MKIGGNPAENSGIPHPCIPLTHNLRGEFRRISLEKGYFAISDRL